MLVDSHCHLDYEVFEEDFSEILQRARNNEVKILQTISTKVTEFPKLKKLIEAYPQIYASIGIHPHEVDEHPETSVEDLFEYTKHPKVIGVGETVSISSFSRGTFLTTSCKAEAFLKVTIPEIEIYNPKSKHSLANSKLSELKQ